MSASDLSLAISLYLGYGTEAYPKPDRGRLVKEFGEVRAAQLASKIDVLLRDLYHIPPDWSRRTLIEAADSAINDMKARYPDLSHDALRALHWDFTFNWK